MFLRQGTLTLDLDGDTVGTYFPKAETLPKDFWEKESIKQIKIFRRCIYHDNELWRQKRKHQSNSLQCYKLFGRSPRSLGPALCLPVTGRTSAEPPKSTVQGHSLSMTGDTEQVWLWIHCPRWIILGFASLGNTLPRNLISSCNHSHLAHLYIFARTIEKWWVSKDTFLPDIEYSGNNWERRLGKASTG